MKEHRKTSYVFYHYDIQKKLTDRLSPYSFNIGFLNQFYQITYKKKEQQLKVLALLIAKIKNPLR